MNNFDNKIDRAVRLIKSTSLKGHVYVAYSGGKDSDVVRRLCEISGVNYTLVYNNNTIDPPGTIQRNIRMGALINRPKLTFLQLIEKKGLPSMFRRFCCDYLKEKFIAKNVVMGIRREESLRRKLNYDSPVVCRIYSKNKHSNVVLPLLTWTNDDLVQFIEEESLLLHPYYYDNGRLNINKRLGCIGCPLLGDRGRADFKRYPRFLRLWAKAYARYVDNHKCINGIYEDLVWHLFYSNHGDDKYQQNFHGLFPAPDAKELLEKEFNIEL